MLACTTAGTNDPSRATAFCAARRSYGHGAPATVGKGVMLVQTPRT